MDDETVRLPVRRPRHRRRGREVSTTAPTVPFRAVGTSAVVSTPVLGFAAAALTVAVVVGPMALASVWPGGGYDDPAAVGRDVAVAFVSFWHANDGVLTAAFARPVDYWARFHLVKAVIAAALLVVTLVLGHRLWRAFALGARSRTVLGVVGVLGAPLPVLWLLMVVANVQGLVAPLSSALSLLPSDPDPTLAQVVDQARATAESGTSGPALDVLVEDFTTYHAVLAGLAVVVTVGLLAAVVVLWRGRRAPVVGSVRWARRAGTAATLLVAVVFGVFAAANADTVADPVPALAAFFEDTGT